MAKSRINDSTTGIKVADSGSVVEEQMLRVQVARRSVLLTRWDGEVYAIDAACPHAAADLAKGTLRRWKICCPDHEYCFDIRNGSIIWPEDEFYRLKRYPVTEENGSIYVQVD